MRPVCVGAAFISARTGRVILLLNYLQWFYSPIVSTRTIHSSTGLGHNCYFRIEHVYPGGHFDNGKVVEDPGEIEAAQEGSSAPEVPYRVGRPGTAWSCFSATVLDRIANLHGYLDVVTCASLSEVAAGTTAALTQTFLVLHTTLVLLWFLRPPIPMKVVCGLMYTDPLPFWCCHSLVSTTI